MRILITGGAGFIGHHIVDYLARWGFTELVLMDRLDGSGNLNRLAEIGAHKRKNVKFVFHDLRAAINDQLASQLGDFEHIIHLAAATHVDRSIAYPMEFVQDNVVATCNLLEFARKQQHLMRFFQFSTDEVFGAAPEGVFYKEDDRFHCSNPYSATKAGAEELAMAYHRTYGVPVVVTHTMNVCGVRQHPEKMIPGTIAKVLAGKTVIIHANKDKGTPGTRFYIDASDVAAAIGFLMGLGRELSVGEKFNVVGKQEVSNLEIAQWIALQLGKELHYELVDGARPGNRPGHDLRYALDGGKMAQLGWEPSVPIGESIADIVEWSLENPQWLMTL